MTNVAAAHYAAAVLGDDHDTVEIFRGVFSDQELRIAVEAQLGLLGRYLGYHLGKSPQEVGDSIRRAAALIQKGVTLP